MEAKTIKIEKIEWKTIEAPMSSCYVCNKKNLVNYFVEIIARLDDRKYWNSWNMVCCNKCKDKDPIEILTAAIL